MPSAFKEYKIAAEAFIQLTTDLVNSDRIGVTAEKYLAAGGKAREASFKLWRIAADELDTLLQKRIRAYELQRTWSLMVAGLALLAAIGFVTFITRSISGPLKRQADRLQEANQTLQAEVRERRRAEEAT